MKLKGVILFGLLLSIGIIQAQTDFRPGYIIKTTGDTLFGQIDFRGDLLMGSVCKFKDADNTIIKYSPEDIVAYRFNDSKYYVTRDVNSQKTFMEYLIKGKINIYYLRDDSGDHYFVDKEGDRLIEIPYEEGIKYIDGKPIYYESKKHIVILNTLMQDAPALQARIQSVKKPEHQNLIKLAEDYHNAVCDDEKCMIYEKKLPFIRILPELVSGVIKYSNMEDINDRFYMHSGVIGHIWMPMTSEKVYFRTGILFSQLDFDGDKTTYYKVPCQIEYIYPKGIFRPRLAYGLNFYKPRYQSVSFNVGGNFKLSETFFLSVTTDFEFNQTMLFVPKDQLSNSFQVGLFVNLK